MDKNEIYRYINVGRNRSITIDRSILEQYQGIIRNITIRGEAELQIDFLDKRMLELDEGEVTFYFTYSSFDKLFASVEKYIGIRMEDWQNYSRTDWYPDVEELDLTSWTKLKIDFINRNLNLPEGFSEFRIASFYWRGLFSGEVKVEDDWETIAEWMRKKTTEEED